MDRVTLQSSKDHIKNLKKIKSKIMDDKDSSKVIQGAIDQIVLLDRMLFLSEKYEN